MYGKAGRQIGMYVLALSIVAFGCKKKAVTASNPAPPVAATPSTRSEAPEAAAMPTVRSGEPVRAPVEPRSEPAAATSAVASQLSAEERLARDVRDVFFDYDMSRLAGESLQVLQRNADALRAVFRDFPGLIVVIEGHCDERGSSEYNLALGDRRAQVVREYLSGLGLPGERLRVVSLGEEQPQCREADESCWHLNRRVHFIAAS